MELKKLVTVLEERFKEEFKGEVKVLIGGSYVLKQVYGLLDRCIDDIDIIVMPCYGNFHSGYNDSVKSEEERKKIRIEFENQRRERTNKIISDIFPTENVHDCTEDYQGPEEFDDWVANVKIQTIVDLCKTSINILVPAKFNHTDYHSRVQYDGLYVTPLSSLLRAKGGYGRSKDHVDFFSMSKKLLNYCKESFNWL